MFLLSLAMAADLSYTQALETAAARNPTLLQAAQQQKSAEGLLLSAHAPFGPQLSASTEISGRTQQQTFFGFATSDATRSFGFNLALSQYLATGTALSLSFAGANDRYISFKTQLSDELPPESWGSDLRLSLSQSLLQGLRLAYNLQGLHNAQRAVSIAEAQQLAARQEILSQTASAYWAAWYQQQLVEIAAQTVQVVQEQQRIVQALVADGRLAAVEQIRVDAAVAEAQRASLEAQLSADRAVDTLQLLLGAPPDGQLHLLSAPATPTEIPLEETTILESVLAGNPDLLVLKLQEAAAEEAVKDARHAMLPELTATGTAGISGYEETFSSSLGELGRADLPSWSLGAQLNLPLLNEADRGALQQREAEQMQRQLQRRAFEDQLAAQVRSLLGRIGAARQRLQLSELNVRLRQETLRAEQARLAEGRALQKDVIEAIKDLNLAQVEVSSARIDHQQALVGLQKLKGDL